MIFCINFPNIHIIFKYKIYVQYMHMRQNVYINYSTYYIHYQFPFIRTHIFPFTSTYFFPFHRLQPIRFDGMSYQTYICTYMLSIYFHVIISIYKLYRSRSRFQINLVWLAIYLCLRTSHGVHCSHMYKLSYILGEPSILYE